MINMVVFDMAGTTVDEDNVVYKTLRKSINEAGYNVSLAQVLRVGAGKEKLQAIKDVLKLEEEGDIAKKAISIFENFKNLLSNVYQELDVKEQSKATEVFRQLKAQHIKVVLNTGYDRQTAEHLVGKIGWKKGVDFDALVTASDVSNGRPEPDMILLAMEKLGVQDASQVIKIGDSGIDIEEGKNAHCGLNIGITTGAQTKEQLQQANPDYIIDRLDEIISIIS